MYTKIRNHLGDVIGYSGTDAAGIKFRVFEPIQPDHPIKVWLQTNLALEDPEWEAANTFDAHKEAKRQWLRDECERIILAKWPVWLQLNALSNPSAYPNYIPERDSVRAESNRVDALVVAVTEGEGKAGIDAAVAQVNWPNIGVLTHA